MWQAFQWSQNSYMSCHVLHSKPYKFPRLGNLHCSHIHFVANVDSLLLCTLKAHLWRGLLLETMEGSAFQEGFMLLPEAMEVSRWASPACHHVSLLRQLSFALGQMSGMQGGSWSSSHFCSWQGNARADSMLINSLAPSLALSKYTDLTL